MRVWLLAIVLALAACGSPLPRSAAPATTTATGAAPSVDQLRAADFSAYPAAAFTGMRRTPDFNGAQREFRTYRTALSDGAARGPNFAGRFALVQIGCGAGCNETYQVDLSTGGVAEIHFAGETAVEIESRPDSALLKARWFVSPADPNGQWRCHFENYLWRDGRLVSLGQAVIDGACPDG
ncbi:MAG: hypothetical protein JSS00_04865 [Proteobacteria bacterium]|nr:hypothetical protein [Pseudomonadota bacterium]